MPLQRPRYFRHSHLTDCKPHTVSSTIAQGKTVQQEGEDLDNEHRWRWVFFPKEIETCGDGSKFDIAPGVPNPNGGQSTPVCGDNVEETQHNICAKTAEIDPNSKQPIVFWAVRKWLAPRLCCVRTSLPFPLGLPGRSTKRESRFESFDD